MFLFVNFSTAFNKVNNGPFPFNPVTPWDTVLPRSYFTFESG